MSKTIKKTPTEKEETKPKHKKLLFLLLLLFGLSLSCKAQKYESYGDTTITTMVVGKCGVLDNNYNISPTMQTFFNTFEKTSTIVTIVYRGSAVIDDKYRSCVVIYKFEFILKNKK